VLRSIQSEMDALSRQHADMLQGLALADLREEAA
jgi:hypothetical protein